jgi:phage-related protein
MTTDAARIELPWGSLLPSQDIFGEECFWTYDDRDCTIGCFRTQAGAERELQARRATWRSRGLAF